MNHSDVETPDRELYINNMEEKIDDPEFVGDTTALIRSEENWNPVEAYKLIKTEIFEKL